MNNIVPFLFIILVLILIIIYTSINIYKYNEKTKYLESIGFKKEVYCQSINGYKTYCYRRSINSKNYQSILETDIDSLSLNELMDIYK